MSVPAIAVRSVGKEYRLGELNRSNTLRDAMSGWFGRRSNAEQHRKGKANGHDERFWALKDVSFDVAEGEVLGIIGANGAGKSTLLKILSRITEPTIGEIELRGRVASLLEVGTGFNDELTGRENIILNGAILGMAKREIDKKFDEIIDFSGVEKFLDTPVKRYSSGMKMRLAFAVAAHLEPEILIIDEVLAVGDAEFQRKCLGKMNEVAQAGRTVLFVSHNMAAVEALCSNGLLLEKGGVESRGPVSDIVHRYLTKRNTTPSAPDETGSKNGIIRTFSVAGEQSGEGMVAVGETAIFRVNLAKHPDIKSIRAIVSVHDNLGDRVFVLESSIQYAGTISLEDEVSLECRVFEMRIFPGAYSIRLELRHYSQVVDATTSDRVLTVTERDIYGTGKFPPRKGGLYLPHVEWSEVALQ